MAKTQIEFKKGDAVTHYFGIPVDSWSSGGKLFFAAKVQPDDDVTDAAAVIDQEFSDSDIIDSDHEMYDPGFVTYELNFPPNAANVSFADGSKSKKFSGEFQYVPTTGLPESFPGSDFLDVVVFADIKRGTS